MKQLTYLLFFLSSFFVNANYQTVSENDCTRAYNKNDYIDAKYACLELADEGNGEASFILAIMYAKGLGVTKDKNKAFEQLQKADSFEHSEAAFNLATAYEMGRVTGVDVEQSKRLAYEYLTRSAQLGSVNGLRKLGILLIDKGSLKYDAKKAATHLTEAVEKGDSKSKLRLGGLYLKGEGVTKNIKHGLALIKQAADEGLAEAQFAYGTLIFQRNATDAITYFKNAAEQGNGFAAHNLALMFHNGDKVEKDREQSKYFAQIALSTGLKQAKRFLDDSTHPLSTSAKNEKRKEHHIVEEKAVNLESENTEASSPVLPDKNASTYVMQFGRFNSKENALELTEKLTFLLTPEILELDNQYIVVSDNFTSYTQAFNLALKWVAEHNIEMPYIRKVTDFTDRTL